MITLSILPLCAIFCGYSGGDGGIDSLFTGTTGEPVLLESPGTTPALSEEEYTAFARRQSGVKYFVGISQKPKQLSANARFGFNLSYGGFSRSWILDGDEKQGYVLYADLNANGNLNDDTPLTFERVNGKYSLMIKTDVTESYNGKEETYPVQIKLEVTHVTFPGKSEKQLALDDYSNTQRSGAVHIGTREIHFNLGGSQGIYDFDYDRISFDINNDGNFSSVERYAVREKYVTIGDSSYEFHVDRYGRNVVLKLLPERLPERPSLETGSAAPEFSFRDIEGVGHRLSDYRGKVVLLDFWGYWCGPCVAELPEVVSTYKEFHTKGFDIVGIHAGDDTSTVRKFITDHAMNWNHTVELEHGALQKLFRINGWPTYYLIGKDGTIVSRTLRPGNKLIQEINTQLKKN